MVSVASAVTEKVDKAKQKRDLKTMKEGSAINTIKPGDQQVQKRQNTSTKSHIPTEQESKGEIEEKVTRVQNASAQETRINVTKDIYVVLHFNFYDCYKEPEASSKIELVTSNYVEAYKYAIDKLMKEHKEYGDTYLKDFMEWDPNEETEATFKEIMEIYGKTESLFSPNTSEERLAKYSQALNDVMEKRCPEFGGLPCMTTYKVSKHSVKI